MILLLIIWRYQNRLYSSILIYQLIYWFYITCMKYNYKKYKHDLCLQKKKKRIEEFWRLYLTQHNSQHPKWVPLSKYLYKALFTKYIQETTNFSSNRDNVSSKHVNLVNINNVYLDSSVWYLVVHIIVSIFVELLGFFVESSDDKSVTQKAEEYANTSFMK